MSSWGYKPFENDDAADWYTELVDEPRWSHIKTPFSRALKIKGYFDVTDGSEVVAAAAIVCELGQKRSKKSELSEEMYEELRNQLEKLKLEKLREIVADAKKALKRIRTDKKNSELLQIWSEEKEYSKWEKMVIDLEKNLEVSLKNLIPFAKDSTTKNRKVTEVKKPEKRIKYKVGLIVAIPLPRGRFAYGKVFNDFDLGIYNFVSNKLEPVEQVIKNKFLFFNGVTSRTIKSGDFPVIGEEPFPDEESAWAPPMVTGGSGENDFTTVHVLHKGQYEYPAAGPHLLNGMALCSMHIKTDSFVSEVIDRLVDGNNEKYKFVYNQRAKVFAIPLPNHKFAYAKVFNSRHVGVYDFLSDKLESLEKVKKNKFLFFNSLYDRSFIVSSEWPIIGEDAFLNEESAWAPPLATGISINSEGKEDLTYLRIFDKGENRSCKPKEADGLYIEKIILYREEFLKQVIDRLVDGNNEKYKFVYKK